MSRKANPDPVQDEPTGETETPVSPSPAPTPPAPPAAPAAPAEAEQPQHGGSFVRQADGTLTLIERTLQPGETAER